MLLGGLQKVSLVDYPGRVAATVFTAGCNFLCPFCHNPELVTIGKYPEQMFLPDEDFFDFLKSRHGLIEGVCVSGGEPTIQENLPEFLKKIKAMGFLTKLDTNGARPEALKNLAKENLVDYLAMDIKGPLDKYGKITGMNIDFEKIHESTELTRQFPDYEFRTTVIPKFHKKEDFLSIAKWLDGAKKYFLQQFRPEKTFDESFQHIRPYPDEKLGEFCNLIKPYFETCEVRI
ncbi:MAG: anaerobic ribonucleoside-triphosphate reductase activating protein [Candidatus Portnoybacteria bacterium RBG_19FT_COMBO_36_7]|uniref:Anaerobic ribonucleoside-triphosphate reductase activating protein n=1 Tax=Candidatus Portnoybacteria bacterium RBG_19FT_COMBO_36_7 TaxID=1801992 RepID=A0A1G2F8T9_9BACT|nr:MAG: anaerobic ribonucleoside-triphosphate reductase activating protein [Candidatus Portnoybacteria bacterium RBG_19FT_COMBO_36_7]